MGKDIVCNDGTKFPQMGKDRVHFGDVWKFVYDNKAMPFFGEHMTMERFYLSDLRMNRFFPVTSNGKMWYRSNFLKYLCAMILISSTKEEKLPIIG